MKKSKVLIAAVVAMLISLCFVIGAGAATANLAAVSKVKAVATTNSATISWSKVKNAKGYRIDEKVKNKWVERVTTTSSACIITDLQAGTAHTYRVTAYTTKGSSKVLSKKYKTLNVLTKPANIKTLKAAAKGNTVTLSWTKATGAKGYKVYQYNTSKGKYVLVKNTTALKFTVSKLSSGKKYTFAVRPYYTSGKTTVLADKYIEKSAVTNPKAPTTLKATEKTADSVSLSWSKAEGATAYRVYKYNSSKKKWDSAVSSTTKRSATVGGLKKNTKYNFAVKAIAKVGSKSYYSDTYIKLSVTTANGISVPKTKADIAKAYNKAVNDLKAYQDLVTMSKHNIINVQIADAPAIATSIITPIISNLTKTSPEEYTFKKSVDVNDPNRYLREKITPWGREACVTASDLKSAKAVKTSSGGYKLTLVFVSEELKFDGTTTTGGEHHMKALDLINLGTLDLGPISVTNATTNYSGAKIVATVDKKGRLIELNVENPFAMNATGKAGISISLGLQGSSNTYMKLNYNSTKAPELKVPTTTAPTIVAPPTTRPAYTEPSTMAPTTVAYY